MKIETIVIIVLLAAVGLYIYRLGCYKETFINQLEPKLIELREKIAPLFRVKYTGVLSCINDCNFETEIAFHEANKSYTINKQNVYLCLKDREGNYYPDLQLIYVTLHELSHVLCKSVGHTDEFNEIFDALLEEADCQGIYDRTYKVMTDYCP